MSTELSGAHDAACSETEAVNRLIERAVQLHGAGRKQDALAAVQRAVAMAPLDPRALNMRGMVLDSLGLADEALKDFERTLQIQPNFGDAFNNIGILHARSGEFEEALVCYERSLRIAPQQPQTLYNVAMARLALGDWSRGFREFEARWRLFPHEAVRLNRLAPVWLGEFDVSGKTVLLHHEQGYGDALQFCRYAPLVMARGANVILAVPAALRTLMGSLIGQPLIVSEGEPVPKHDYCCSLMSLPLVFGTTPDNVPATIPYLRADAHAVRSWSQRLGSRSRPRIGLAWSGRRYPPINHPRDIPLEALRPLLKVQADFVCLQPELSDCERTLLSAFPNVRYGDTFTDFADTAALIENLDLIITVDTAVAHLAGALGKPVWLLNRYAACWRWLQKRSDSSWYPTLRQFRQPSLGDWTNVVREVHCAADLFVALEAQRRGHLNEAISIYRGILVRDPVHPDALHYVGVALAQQGQFDKALPLLSLAIRVQPDNAVLHNHYGNALAGLGRYTESLASYDQAISLDGALADAHYNRGVALAELHQLEWAISSYKRAIQLNPSYAEAHNNLGNALAAVGRHSQALRCYEAATEIRQDFVSAWVNRANTLRSLIRYEEALACTKHALLCDPQHAEAHGSRGAILASIGRYDEALSSYRRAIELKPSLADATWNKAIAHLARGEFREGWVHYEARWNVKTLGLTSVCGPRPAWSGREALRHRVILLHSEQGYGDTIQFCRYAPLVASRGARVVLGVPSALHRLMGSLEGIAEVITQGALPRYDHHCPLLSLPLAFGTELETIPAPTSYLQADPADRASWAERLGPRRAPRVGFAWSGRPTHTNDLNRSIGLEKILPLTQCGVQCVSVQKEVRAADEAVLTSSHWIQRLGEGLTDFADAAALVSELDLIVTVDTAIAHLAGALGKPVWILLPYVADWRWLQLREDSPWYPSARLFRQPSAGDWDGVVERVMLKLRDFIEEQTHAQAQ